MIRKIKAAVACISLFAIYCVVGGMEFDRIPLNIGTVICAICLISFAWSVREFRYQADRESESDHEQ